MNDSVKLSLYIEQNYPVKHINSIVNRKPRYGVGINDANYTTQPRVEGKQLIDPAYDAWQGMIRRAYSNKLHDKHPTYKNVKVCNEWLIFSNFRKWWLNNYKEGWQLDKDLLCGNDKIYSPETCIYIPQWLNKFITGHDNARGAYKIGVSFHNLIGKYQACCNNPLHKRQESIGYYDNEDVAHLAYKTRKLEILKELKEDIDSIDTRLYPSIKLLIENRE